jgi:hypothetical protein
MASLYNHIMHLTVIVIYTGICITIVECNFITEKLNNIRLESGISYGCTVVY